MRFPHIAAALLAAACAPALADTPVRVAVFDFELIDTSLEGEKAGPRADEQQRLRSISDQVRDALAASATFAVVDTRPAAAEIDGVGYLHGCNGCEADIARGLGAALALTGTVQKVSNLILNINLYVRDAATGERQRAMSVDIRGNTDESWRRGVSYLLRNRLLPHEQGAERQAFRGEIRHRSRATETLTSRLPYLPSVAARCRAAHAYAADAGDHH